MRRKEAVSEMTEIRNLNKKRVGDLSVDERVFVILLKDCVTRIRCLSDGTLSITHERIEPAQNS